MDYYNLTNISIKLVYTFLLALECMSDEDVINYSYYDFVVKWLYRCEFR
ncbi:hypothetical protein C7427_11521 [Pantoea ananatis]|nr:hypothetical protein C7427_11521 [Pantoea ananatis]